MQTSKLAAQIRKVTGKKVRKLRREGLIPLVIYGKDIKSQALSVPMKEFLGVYDKAGGTGLVELTYENKSQHVLIKNVQFHPLYRTPLHAEVQAVKLTEKIKTTVPLELIGESPAVANNIGVMIQTLNEIQVEALPTDLPEKITVDISNLSEVGQHLEIKDLKKLKGVEILSPENSIVVNVGAAVAAETAKEIAAEEAAKAATAATEGQAPGAESGTIPPKEEENKEKVTE